MSNTAVKFSKRNAFTLHLEDNPNGSKLSSQQQQLQDFIYYSMRNSNNW